MAAYNQDKAWFAQPEAVALLIAARDDCNVTMTLDNGPYSRGREMGATLVVEGDTAEAVSAFRRRYSNAQFEADFDHFKAVQFDITSEMAIHIVRTGRCHWTHREEAPAPLLALALAAAERLAA